MGSCCRVCDVALRASRPMLLTKYGMLTTRNMYVPLMLYSWRHLASNRCAKMLRLCRHAAAMHRHTCSYTDCSRSCSRSYLRILRDGEDLFPWASPNLLPSQRRRQRLLFTLPSSACAFGRTSCNTCDRRKPLETHLFHSTCCTNPLEDIDKRLMDIKAFTPGYVDFRCGFVVLYELQVLLARLQVGRAVLAVSLLRTRGTRAASFVIHAVHLYMLCE